MSLLALEPVLVERLRTECPGVHIGRIREVTDLRRERIPTPALMVGYRSGSVPHALPNGLDAQVEQRWLVVAVVRNVADDSDAAAREALSPVVDAALAALMGWQPGGVLAAPLRISGLPEAGYGSGYLWLPMEFSARSVLKRPCAGVA
jgi:hypothetical protein